MRTKSGMEWCGRKGRAKRVMRKEGKKKEWGKRERDSEASISKHKRTLARSRGIRMWVRAYAPPKLPPTGA